MKSTASTRIGRLACIALLAQLLPLLASAQPTDRGERGSLMLGAFITDRDSHTRLDSDLGPGTDIDLEDTLGLDSSTSVARLGGYFWLGERHRIDAAYFDLSRSSTVPIKETIDFGDETFLIDTVIETEAELTIVKVDYTFAALARERGFLGVTGGLYVAQTRMSLSQATLGQAESEGLTAPLPLIGLHGEYAIGEHITLRGAMQWFGFESDNVSGRFTDFNFGADYGFGERMAVGLAYNRVSMNIGAQEGRGFNGRLDWGYDGLVLYFKLDFHSRN